MRNKIFAILATVLLIVLLVPVSVFADEDDKKGEVKILDYAGLLSESEEKALREQLSELTGYGNMGIYTNEDSNSDAAALARAKYIDMFGETDGTLFLVDMYNRRLQIFSGGDVYKTITTAKANEITDNVYTYASKGDYYGAASKAFEQIKITLEGGHILTPMRYATNFALAAGIVLIINFIIITSQRKKDKNAKVLTNALYYENANRNTSVVRNVTAIMTNQKKKKHVESSGGVGGGGGGFSGGGGGGGFSGGGGGHSF